MYMFFSYKYHFVLLKNIFAYFLTLYLKLNTHFDIMHISSQPYFFSPAQRKKSIFTTSPHSKQTHKTEKH
jgi:hypothetical protein